ncbi:unnamed protein product [Merluccius merluccius]
MGRCWERRLMPGESAKTGCVLVKTNIPRVRQNRVYSGVSALHFGVDGGGVLLGVLLRFISRERVLCAEIHSSEPFPSEDTALNEDDVYRSLEELADEHDLGEDDIYDCVPCEDDGDDIYEDIIKVEVRQPMKMGMTEDDKRNCCLVEIQETEAKYYKTLEDIEKNYMTPLKQVFNVHEMEAVFVNLEDVIKVHFALLRAIDLNMVSGGTGLGNIFLDFKER